MKWLYKVFKKRKDPYPLIISFFTLRRIVGILGVSLPAILIIGAYIVGGCTNIQDSISHYYYTAMRDVFVGILSAIAIFLISYRGYQPKDNIATTLAGIFAICVAFFPTTQNQDTVCTVYYIDHSSLRIYIHYGSAVLLFTTLAYISFFLFTRGPKRKRKRKILRNKVFRTCGVILILSVILITLIRIIPSLENSLGRYNAVFWIEWIGLIAFGVSWMVKGNLLFKDYVNNQKNK